MIGDYKTCPRYFQYRHLEGLTLYDKLSNFKPAFGTAIHGALEKYYTEVKGGASLEDRDLWTLAVDEFKRLWNPYEGTDLTGLRTMIRGELACRQYFDKFKHDQFKVLETEIGGAISVEEFTIIFKADMVIEDPIEGVTVFETKTSGHRGYLIVKPNAQLDTYIFGVRAHTGLDIKGAILNQIYFRKGRKGECITKTLSFEREGTERNDAELEEWYRDVIQWCSKIKLSVKENYFPRNTNSCTAYGGCMFLSVCKHNDPSVVATLKQGYKKEMWEPWEGARGLGKVNDKTKVGEHDAFLVE